MEFLVQRSHFPLVLCFALRATLPAQDDRGLAIVNARILPISGPAIDKGTLLVRQGKIEQLGADVAPPAGYRVVDAAGGTLLPGAINAHTHTGLTSAQPTQPERPNQFRRGGRGRRGGGTPAPAGSGENKAGERVIDQLYARQDVFNELLRDGVTTLGIAPLGRGLPGQGAAVRPRGDDAAAMTLAASAFVAIAPAAETKTKDLIRRALEDGKRALERRQRRAEQEAASKAEETKAATEPVDKKPDAGPKDQGDQPGDKPSEKPSEKPADKPAERPVDGKPAPDPTKDSAGARPADSAAPTRGRGQAPDPGTEAIADLLDGKSRALVQVDSAMEFLHWADAAKDATFPLAIVARRHASAGTQGSLEVVLDKLKQTKAMVLMSPEFATVPNTEYLVNLAARLHGAGVEVGFLLGERGRALQTARTQLMELVRAGLPADVALRGITLTPAKALGIDKQVGSLEVGKLANLMLWTADPFDPSARLHKVWLEGHEIEDDAR
jgi:cytosine/adenosine deaminase-related metal-dependent hydrolase